MPETSDRFDSLHSHVMNSAADDADMSVSLVRGLCILSAFVDGRALGITELTKQYHLSKSTVHRYVNTLKTLGYLEQDPRTSKYRLGMRAVKLGLAALESMELRHVALPYLEGLASEYGHSVNLAVLDHDDVIYIERVRVKRIIDIDLHVGSRLPAYCTAIGKVLLAYLPKVEQEAVLGQMRLEQRGPNTITDREELERELDTIHENGFSVSNEELAYGLRAAAAPIRSAQGEVIAAVNIAVHADMTPWDEIYEVLVPALVTTANKISSRLGYRKGNESGAASAYR